jgi:hypothetical protein
LKCLSVAFWELVTGLVRRTGDNVMESRSPPERGRHPCPCKCMPG